MKKGFTASLAFILVFIIFDVSINYGFAEEKLSPLKQIQSGIEPKDVKCYDGLQSIFRPSNDYPACVKPDTKEELVERGWKESIMPLDTDYDGIPDDLDQCPTEEETMNGYKDDDGCIDFPILLDSDNDRIPDFLDQCILEKETENAHQDEDGCPDTSPADESEIDIHSGDIDWDGIIDVNDACPTQSENFNEYKDDDGCWDIGVKDEDSDGIPDDFDKCLIEKEIVNQYFDQDGCADTLPISRPIYDSRNFILTLDKSSYLIGDKIHYELNQTDVEPKYVLFQIEVYNQNGEIVYFMHDGFDTKSYNGIIDTTLWKKFGVHRIMVGADTLVNFSIDGIDDQSELFHAEIHTDKESYDFDSTYIRVGLSVTPCNIGCTVDANIINPEDSTTRLISFKGNVLQKDLTLLRELPINDDMISGDYTIELVVRSSTGISFIEKRTEASFSVIEFDSDGDGLRTLFDNCPTVSNIDQKDIDMDGFGDVCDLDNDNDRLTDFFENSIGTNPLNGDTDGDGRYDYGEVLQGTNPLKPDIDSDGDSLVDYLETFRFGTDPNKVDTDGDGLSDSQEIHRSDPLKVDTDNDGFNDPVDECPKIAEDYDSRSFNEGCPGYPECSDPHFVIAPQNFISTCLNKIDKNYFAEKKLEGLTFNGNLNGFKFYNTKFINVIFDNAVLTVTDFTGSTFQNVTFIQSGSPHAIFSNTRIENSNFEMSQFAGADFSNSYVFNVKFHPNLVQANFADADLLDVDLSSKNLQGAKFRDATLVAVNLNSAKLQQVDFTNAFIENSELYEIQTDKTVFKGATITCNSPFEPETAPSNTNYSIDIDNPYGGQDVASRMRLKVIGPSEITESTEIPIQQVLGTVRIASCFYPPVELPIYETHHIGGERHALRSYEGLPGAQLNSRFIEFMSPLGGKLFVEYEYPSGSQTYTLTDSITINQMPTSSLFDKSKYDGDLKMRACPVQVDIRDKAAFPKKSTECDKVPIVTDAGYTIGYDYRKTTASLNDYFMLYLYDDKENESELAMFAGWLLGQVFNFVLGMATGGFTTYASTILGLGNAIGVTDASSTSVGGFIADQIKEDLKGSDSLTGWIWSDMYMLKHPVILVETSDGNFYTYGIKVSDVTDISGDKIRVLYYNNNKWITVTLEVAP